jgi:hypothetical protein
MPQPLQPGVGICQQPADSRKLASYLTLVLQRHLIEKAEKAEKPADRKGRN